MTAVEVNELVDQHIDFALSIARSWGRRWPWLADDFASAAGLALWIAARYHKPEKGTFRSLVRVAVRRALWVRWQKELKANPTSFRQPPSGIDGEPLDPVSLIIDDSPEVGSRLEAAELIELARASGDQLDFALLERHAVNDCTMDELAAAMGVSRARVGQRLERARRVAREALEANSSRCVHVS